MNTTALAAATAAAAANGRTMTGWAAVAARKGTGTEAFLGNEMDAFHEVNEYRQSQRSHTPRMEVQSRAPYMRNTM